MDKEASVEEYACLREDCQCSPSFTVEREDEFDTTAVQQTLIVGTTDVCQLHLLNLLYKHSVCVP